MKNFIDTNMALGYTFSCDKWHDLAKDFFKNKDEVYWSNNVEKEFNSKYEEIFKEISNFMIKILSLLKTFKKSFINYYSFENIFYPILKLLNQILPKKLKLHNIFGIIFQLIIIILH